MLLSIHFDEFMSLMTGYQPSSFVLFLYIYIYINIYTETTEYSKYKVVGPYKKAITKIIIKKDDNKQQKTGLRSNAIHHTGRENRSNTLSKSIEHIES